jgi:hypothetical protein
MRHKLEVAFARTFTIEEVEALKDAIYLALAKHQNETGVQVLADADLIVLDA